MLRSTWCIRCVALSELDEDEIAFLVQMLDVSKGGELSESLLTAVLGQLQELASATEASAASKSFKSRLCERTVLFVFEILTKNLGRATEDNLAKQKLSQGCLSFLLAISREPSLRGNLRGPAASWDGNGQ